MNLKTCVTLPGTAAPQRHRAYAYTAAALREWTAWYISQRPRVWLGNGGGPEGDWLVMTKGGQRNEGRWWTERNGAKLERTVAGEMGQDEER